MFLTKKHLPRRTFRGTGRLRVWGLVRVAPNGKAQKVSVEFRRRHSTKWRAIRTLTTEPGRGYVDSRVRIPGTGAVRFALQAMWQPFGSHPIDLAPTPGP